MAQLVPHPTWGHDYSIALIRSSIFAVIAKSARAAHVIYGDEQKRRTFGFVPARRTQTATCGTRTQAYYKRKTVLFQTNPSSKGAEPPPRKKDGNPKPSFSPSLFSCRRFAFSAFPRFRVSAFLSTPRCLAASLPRCLFLPHRDHIRDRAEVQGSIGNCRSGHGNIAK
jgi:hypothetical protein